MSVICLEKTEQDGKVRISDATESSKHLHSSIKTFMSGILRYY